MTTKASSSSSEFLINKTPINNSKNSTCSRFLQTVCLEDWWLIKSEDANRLCIQGYTVSENRARRVFSSAPITKKYSLIKLKTADGINILLGGTINKSRTLENGFSSEVCSRFLLGFPYDWEDVANRCLGQESAAGNGAAALNSMSDFDESKDVLSSLPNWERGKEVRVFESSKSTSKGGKLESKGQGCSYDAGTDEVLKDAPASLSSDVKEKADPYEASVAVPVDILSTKGKVGRPKGKVGRPKGKVGGAELAKAKGVVTKRKVGRPKKKGKRSRTIPGSSGCGVVQVHVEEDLISHGSEGNLERSKPETPVVTVDDSSLQRHPEANVSCSIEVGLDSFKVAPLKVAATRTSSGLKIIEGKGNRALKCSDENVSSISGPLIEDFETPKKVMIKSCESNPSSCNIDREKEIISSSKARIKILANDLKDEQPTDYKIQLGTPGSKMMNKEVSPLPASKSKKKNQLSSGQESPYFNPKRSRSGRLRIPPLEFWRNQQVLYVKF
ncbi:hypothetical protein MKW98_005972 [Papaver atlanticum]|uniref:SANTA domain-containing protein n=1 Tax=Papaver atlanticum TaxID=357466 RepID=A0AAD4S6D2_9MAGN|nr:hypothetical protein MKW98_005972 [Papaver atlanticum]